MSNLILKHQSFKVSKIKKVLFVFRNEVLEISFYFKFNFKVEYES